MIKLLSTVYCILFFCGYCFAEKLVLSDSIRIAREQSVNAQTVASTPKNNDISEKGDLKAREIPQPIGQNGVRACSVEDLKKNPAAPSCDKIDVKRATEQVKNSYN